MHPSVDVVTHSTRLGCAFSQATIALPLADPEISTKPMIILVVSTAYEHTQRQRPAVRVGICCSSAVRLLAMFLRHQSVSSLKHAVFIDAATIIKLCRHVFLSQVLTGLFHTRADPVKWYVSIVVVADRQSS